MSSYEHLQGRASKLGSYLGPREHREASRITKKQRKGRRVHADCPAPNQVRAGSSTYLLKMSPETFCRYCRASAACWMASSRRRSGWMRGTA